MSLLFGRRESRSVSYSDVWSTGGDVSGLRATSVDKALRLVPLYAATRLIADQFASIPLHGYRARTDGTRERLSSPPRLLSQPSASGTVYDWKHRLVTSLLLRGNAYGIVTSTDSGGWPGTVEWLNPDAVSVDESGAAPAYYLNGRPIPRESLVHVVGYSLPGTVVGVSPIAAFQSTILAGSAAQDFARDWFINGAVPSVHVKNTAKTLNPGEADAVKSRYKAAVRGRDVLVTGSDYDLTTIGVPADEARFIETLKLTATQIASVYGIPPEMIGGETGSSMTYANVEQQAINFVSYTLRPWLVRVEEAVTALMPRPQYARFNVDAIIRGDLLTRMQAHEIATRVGVETNDEARALEDRAPLTPEQLAAWQSQYRAGASSLSTRDATGGTE